MSNRPLWLPEILSVDGEWEDILPNLYFVFEKDFPRGHPMYDNRPVWWNRTIRPGEKYEEGFWHLITRSDKQTCSRLLDPRRAERLPWCAPTILHSDATEIQIWDYSESSGRIRTYLWLQDYDYLVVLEKRHQRGRAIAFLITAYYVDGERTRENLRRKFQKRLT
ncbi:MAG TPA: hypothetical protein PLI09_10585 [Candidatus Hydrogenedentes bacterium]|nr:hypothetical protein [Candidatus Hydrogenedentota bacterium]